MKATPFTSAKLLVLLAAGSGGDLLPPPSRPPEVAWFLLEYQLLVLEKQQERGGTEAAGWRGAEKKLQCKVIFSFRHGAGTDMAALGGTSRAHECTRPGRDVTGRTGRPGDKTSNLWRRQPDDGLTKVGAVGGHEVPCEVRPVSRLSDE